MRIRGLIAVGLLILLGFNPSMVESQIPPCVPQPYPVQFDLSDLKDTNTIQFALKMQDFLETKVVEEIYLRFCWWIDSSFEMSCNIWVDSIWPCNNNVVIDADEVHFVDDVGGYDPDGSPTSKGRVNFVFQDTIHPLTKVLFWDFPDSLRNTYAIGWSENAPDTGIWLWDFYGFGRNMGQHWRPHDRLYQQQGFYTITDTLATMDTISLAQYYKSANDFRVFLTWATPCAYGAQELYVLDTAGNLSDHEFIVGWTHCPGRSPVTEGFHWNAIGVHKEVVTPE